MLGSCHFIKSGSECRCENGVNLFTLCVVTLFIDRHLHFDVIVSFFFQITHFHLSENSYECFFQITCLLLGDLERTCAMCKWLIIFIFKIWHVKKYISGLNCARFLFPHRLSERKGTKLFFFIQITKFNSKSLFSLQFYMSWYLAVE